MDQALNVEERKNYSRTHESTHLHESADDAQ